MSGLRITDWLKSSGGSAYNGASTSTYRKKRREEEEQHGLRISDWLEQNPTEAEDYARRQRPYREQYKADTSRRNEERQQQQQSDSKVNEVVQWGRAVRQAQPSQIGELVRQSQNFESYFKKNKDKFSGETMQSVINLLNNGKALLQKNGSKIIEAQHKIDSSQTLFSGPMTPARKPTTQYEDEIFDLELKQKELRQKDADRRMAQDHGVAGRETAQELDEVEQKLAQLRAQNKALKQQQKLTGYYNSTHTMPDFEERSKYQNTANGKGYGWSTVTGELIETGFDDVMYDFINKNPWAKAAVESQNTYGDERAGTTKKELQTMTDEEVGTFNYLYANDRDKAFKYIEEIRPTLLARQAQIDDEEWSKFAEEGGPFASAVSAFAKPITSGDALIGMAIDKLQGNEIDPNAGYTSGMRAVNSIRDTRGDWYADQLSGAYADTARSLDIIKLSNEGKLDKETAAAMLDNEGEYYQNLTDENFGKDVKKFGKQTYNSVMSVLDMMVASAMTGGVGGGAGAGAAAGKEVSQQAALVLLSSQAMPETIVGAKQRGLTDTQAISLGVISAMAEYVTEKVSIEAMFDMERLAKEGMLKYAGTAALTEGSEEVASDFINTIADEVISKDKSEFQQSIQQYEAQGMSHEEALKAAWADKVEETAYSFFGGALAGGGMATGVGAVNKIDQARMNDVGAEIKAENPDNAMIQRMGNEEVARMASDQAQAARLEEIGETAKRQAADQIEAGEEVNPALIQALMTNQNALGVLEEQTGSEEIQTEEQLANALREYVNNREEIETAQVMDEPYRMLDQTGTQVSADYVSSRPALSAAVSEGTISNTFGEEGAKIYNDVANRAIESGLSPQQAYQEISQIYNAGNNRTNIKWSTNLPEADVAAVFKAGFQDAVKYAQNDEARVSFASATGGTGVVENDLIRSLQTDPKTAKKINTMNRVAQALGLRVNYVEHIDGANGYFNQKTKEIYIAADAEEGAALAWVFGHEMTHRLQQIAPAEYNTLKQSVQTALGGRFNVEVQRELNKALREGAQMTQQEAQDEAVANFVGELVNDRNALDNFIKEHSGTKEGKSLLTKIRDFFRNLLNKISRAYGEIVEVDPIQRTIDALTAAIETGAANVANYNLNQLDRSGEVLTDNNGNPIAEFQEDGSVVLSLRSYEENGRKIYQNYLNRMVKKGELSKQEADDMMAELETIYDISKKYADSGKYIPFAAWSSADVIYNSKGKPVFSSIKKNSEYKMNIDFSTICKKRRTLDAVFREMVRRGMLEQLDLNKDESAAMVVNINDLIREHGFEAACALCFVEARRYRQQQTATTFRDMWNDLVESMYKDKSKIAYFNFGKDETVADVADGIHTMENKALDLKYVKKIANERKEDGKLMQTAEAKAARLLLKDPSQRKLMRIGDMMASTGFENMQIENPALMKIYNSKKGTGGAKSSFGDVQYLNEIIKSQTFDRLKAYAVSGVRIQSFSDYVPRMVFDYVQVIADLAAKRLPAHAYTKEVLFVQQFGLTGAKINMSLVPDVVEDGVAPGLDKNGNYIWNEEGTFPFEEAKAIQKAEGYKENCGTIAVGISDEQIMKMLADPEIQMVIPYHKSSLNPIVAAMTNVDRFENYEDYQNTKDANGKKVEKDFDWDNKLFALSHDKNGKLLPKSKWGNVQDLVQEYVNWCNKKNYTPKFSQFLYLEDGSINPGYYKLLEDFALLDNDGNFKPQGDVQMRFPTEADAFGSMASLIESGLSEDTKLEKKRASEISGIVDEIQKMVDKGTIAQDKSVRKSRRDSDYLIQGDTARWTDERIDSLIADYGASNPDYSQAYAVLMNPRDYLKLTLSDDILEKWNEGSNDPNHPETYSLNEERLRENSQTPFLSIYSNDGTEVQGHEGRHRMRALLEAGIKSVPVVIRDMDTKYTKTSMESMTLTAQDFGNDPVNNNAHVTVTDLVPIKSSNREELIRKFGGDASVRFSRKESDARYLELAKDPEANVDELRKMVAEAAREAGYDKKLYHGTSKKFTSFKVFGSKTLSESAKLAVWLSDSLKTAASYSTPGYTDYENEAEWDSISKEAEKISEEIKDKVYHEELPFETRIFLNSNGYMNLAALGEAFKKYLPEDYAELLKRGVFVENEKYVPITKENYAEGNNEKVWIDVLNRRLKLLDWVNEAQGIYIHPSALSTYVFDAIDRAIIRSLSSGEISPRILEVFTDTRNFATAEPPFQKDEEKVKKIKSAKKRGKSGIVFPGMRDGGDRSTHYAVFDTNLIKSADPVTYDDAGNVIPLSERFNPENNDIRFSRKDSEGRTLSDNQQKYFKDSKVRDAEGNLLVVYHGSPATDITVFDRERAGEHTGAYSDRAIWFTANKKFADDFSYEFKPTDSMFYVERGAKGRVYPGYLNIVNPFDLTNPTQEMKEILYRGVSEIYKDAETKINELLEIGNHQLLKKYLDFGELEAAGYDGIIAKLDVKGNDLEYGIFNSNQAKDVANLNPTENEDIRKSRRSGETMSSLLDMAEANYRDERVHQEFMSAATKWRTDVSALNEVGSSGFNNRMSSLIRDYAPDTDAKTVDKLVGNIRSLTRTMMRNPDISYGEISDKAGEIASKIMWGKEGITDNIAYHEDAAQAVEDIKNDMLAQILATTTKGEGKYQRLAKEFSDYKAKANKNISEVRRKRDARLQEIKETKERERERRKDSAVRTRLLKVMKRIDNYAKHASGAWKDILSDAVAEWDLTAKGITGEKIEKLEDMRDYVKKMKEIDPNFMPSERVMNDLERLGKKRISEIDSMDEAITLTEALLHLEHEFRTYKQLIDSQYNENIVELGSQIYDDVMATKGVGNTKVPVLNWFQQTVDSKIATPTIRPETEVLRLVGFNRNSPLYQIMYGTEHSLASGQRDAVRYQWTANKTYFDKFLNDRAFVKEIMGKDAKEYKITGRNADGEIVTLSVTPDLLMALYMHSKNDQNFRHFGEWTDEKGKVQHGDGITIPDYKLYKKGNLEEAYRVAARDGNKLIIPRSSLNAAMEQLTNKERAFINAAQRYYSEMSQPEINKVSEKLLGYGLAQVENYFRINTDADYRGTNMDAIKMDGTIEGMGFTKERLADARNAILLISLSEQLRRDIDAHSKYVGLAIPVRNFNKAMGINRATVDAEGNWKGSKGSVQSAIHGKWGRGANSYLQKLMRDIQNPVRVSEAYMKTFGRLRSKYAGAVLALNAGVAIKQAASYPTAAAEIGWVPLIKAFGNSSLIKSNRLNMDLVNKYSPLMYLRTQGMGYQELADLKNLSSGWLNRALNSKALNWIQDMDVATVKKLWKASEYYVRSNFEDLEVGSEAYYKKVGEVHSTVIERTQPNYTTLQRGEILRSDSDLIRTILGMFKTQPFQNFSILFESTGELSAAIRAKKANNTEATRAAVKMAGKRFARALSSQLISSFVFALMQGVWDWLRGKDDKYKDKDGNLTIGSVFKRLAINMGANGFGMIPFGNVIFETAEAVTDTIIKSNEGESFFDAMIYGLDASTATGLINDFQSMIVSLTSNFANFDADSKTSREATVRGVVDALAKLAQMGGYPADNFIKDGQTVATNVFRGLGETGTMNKYMAEFNSKRVFSAINSKSKGEYMDILYRAYDSGDMKAYNELYKIYIKEDGLATKTKSAQESVDSLMTNHVAEAAKKKYWDSEAVKKAETEAAEKRAESAAEKKKALKDAGVSKKMLLEYKELLTKNDKDYNGKSAAEIYDTLMEIDANMKQKKAIWAYEGQTSSLDNYAKKRKKQEAKQRKYDSVGITDSILEEYKQKRSGTGQKATDEALWSMNITNRQRETLWDENGWETSFWEYQRKK